MRLLSASIVLATGAAMLGWADAALAKPLMAISAITYADTSGEPSDADHGKRIQALESRLVDGLTASGLFDVRPVSAPDCPDTTSACTQVWAKATGGDLILVGAVLKTSTLISHFWVGVFKPDGKTRVYFRDLQFRGDTLDAWSHAGDYLVKDIVKAAPGF